MKNHRKTMVVLICIALLCSMPLFAGGKPLQISASDPADCGSGVALNGVISLTFSNNVVNFSVSESNKACITLQTTYGEPVPIEILMADDQVEPEKKRDVTVKPLENLKAFTSYELVISGAFQAKNGSALETDQVIYFTTGSKTQ